MIRHRFYFTKKKYFYLVLLILYGIFHTSINYYWTSNNCLIPYFDPASHLSRGLILHYVLEDISILPLFQESSTFPIIIEEAIKSNLGEFLTDKVLPMSLLRGNYYPPLVYVVSNMVYTFFGTFHGASTLILSIFIFILLFSIYGIGKELYNEKTGFYAAILSMLYPGLYLYSRLNFLDFPLVAMLSLSVFLLIKTNYFKNRFYSILFGISLALGMLTKWAFAVFIIGPFIYYLFKSGIKNYKNILISIFTGFIISLPWYILNPSFLQVFIFSMISYASTGPSYTFSPSYLLQFIDGIVTSGLTLIGFLFFALALFLLINKKDKPSRILYIWILVSLGIFSLTHNVQLRYLLPIYPAFALITIAGIKRFPVRVLLIVLMSLIFISWYSPTYSNLYAGAYEIEVLDKSCSPKDWKTKEILMEFPLNSNIGIINHKFPLSDDYFYYIAKRENINVNIHSLRRPFIIHQIQDLNYLIYIGNENSSWLNEERMEFLYNDYRLFLNEPFSSYIPLVNIEKDLIETRQLPKGVTIYVYNVTK